MSSLAFCVPLKLFRGVRQGTEPVLTAVDRAGFSGSLLSCIRTVLTGQKESLAWYHCLQPGHPQVEKQCQDYRSQALLSPLPQTCSTKTCTNCPLAPSGTRSGKVS